MPGLAAKVRPRRYFSTHLKRELIERYHPPGKATDDELDHYIPLELGGCPDCLANLWLEPLESPGAHEKDRVENYLHKEVCRDHMSLAEAQRLITQDCMPSIEPCQQRGSITVS